MRNNKRNENENAKGKRKGKISHEDLPCVHSSAKITVRRLSNSVYALADIWKHLIEQKKRDSKLIKQPWGKKL